MFIGLLCCLTTASIANIKHLGSSSSFRVFAMGYVYYVCLQEDLPYTEDWDDLGPLLDEDLPIDCATPSSSRLTHPPSTLLGSEFGRRSDVFCVSSPSINPSVAPRSPTIVTLDDSLDDSR